MRKHWMGYLLLCLLLAGSWATAEEAAPFADKVVEDVVRQGLRLEAGTVLTEAMLQTVSYFEYDPQRIWEDEGHGRAEPADFVPAPYPQIGTLEDLRRMPNLVEVAIWHQPIDDISVLAELDRLAIVQLGWCPGVTDLSALAGKRTLTGVSLTNIPARDLTPVLTLAELDTLYLIDMPYAEDLSPLARTSGLLSFRFNSAYAVPDYGVLAGHPNLEDVSVSGLDDAGLERLLADVPNLRYLSLDGGTVTDAGMDLLAGHWLYQLALRDVPGVTRLDVARTMPELAFVTLTGGPVRDLTPLIEGPEMYGLTLREVEGFDLSPVAKMDKLLWLEVPESDEWPLEAVQALAPCVDLLYGDLFIPWMPYEGETPKR